MAKINWFLHVGDSRPDGYHELHTLYQSISFSDTIRFSNLPDKKCVLSGFPEEVLTDSNLVYRAWNITCKMFPDKAKGLDVRVDKYLPLGGGLGGGSSNAAATLNALNSLWHLNLQAPELENIAAGLGSDVPFFIRNGIALGTGHGEILEHLPPIPTYHLVLVLPGQPMSTSQGFRLLDSMQRVSPSQHTVSKFLTTLHSNSPTSVAESFLPNDFELVAQRFEWYNSARAKLTAAGALKVFLCGSGSTVAALARDEVHATEIAKTTGGIIAHTTNATL